MDQFLLLDPYFLTGLWDPCRLLDLSRLWDPLDRLDQFPLPDPHLQSHPSDLSGLWLL